MPKATPAILPRFEGINLTPSQETFVVAYCSDFTFNGTKAASIAYPEQGEASWPVTASENLRKVNVRQAIRRQMEYQLQDKDQLAKRIIEEHSRIAFAHSVLVLNGFTGVGVLVKSLDEIPEEARAAIASVEGSDNGIKVRFYDKQKSLDSLARILGMFDDGAAKVGEKYEDLIQRVRDSQKQGEPHGDSQRQPAKPKNPRTSKQG